MIKESKRQKQRRQDLKDGIENVCSSNKEAANVVKSFNRKQQRRQRIEAEQPELVSTIVKLVQSSTAVDKRRRTECLRSVTMICTRSSQSWAFTLVEVPYNIAFFLVAGIQVKESVM